MYMYMHVHIHVHLLCVYYMIGQSTLHVHYYMYVDTVPYMHVHHQ